MSFRERARADHSRRIALFPPRWCYGFETTFVVSRNLWEVAGDRARPHRVARGVCVSPATHATH